MLNFGTGGMPLTSKEKGVMPGLERLSELGLNHLELEFVYQNFVKPDQAAEIKARAEELGISLSIHGSYYINLASPEKPKVYASINRILSAAKIGDLLGARSITYHAAAYMKRDKQEVYELVKDATKSLLEEYDKEGLKIKISPELTGKAAQFADLEDLIRLVEELNREDFAFCFDFAHKHARDGGGWNSLEEFNEMLGLIKSRLGQKFLDDMHIHVSGINYSEKGERNHLTFLPSQEAYRKAGVNVGEQEDYYKTLAEKGRLDEPDFKWQELMQALKSNKVGGFVVCESPNLEEDALLMQNYYNSLK